MNRWVMKVARYIMWKMAEGSFMFCGSSLAETLSIIILLYFLASDIFISSQLYPYWQEKPLFLSTPPSSTHSTTTLISTHYLKVRGPL
ncbi:hypothetical protein WG66_011430 [Moniliophthora roreri]|nr:hypothetical protein WG66_011430 [Moniliophthora roreri]